MMASLAIVVSEVYHPLWNGVIDGPAIGHMAQMETIIPSFWILPTVLTGICEVASIAKGWAPFSETRGTLSWLKEDYTPVSRSMTFYSSLTANNHNSECLMTHNMQGDLGFDPLGLKPTDPEEFRIIRTKELQNGRLAMLATAGFIAQELIDGKTVLAHLGL